MAKVLPPIEGYIVIKQDEWEKLDSVLGGIPAAFSITPIDLLRLIKQKRTIESKVEENKKKEAEDIK